MFNNSSCNTKNYNFSLSSNKIDSFQRGNSFQCLIIHLVILKIIQQIWILWTIFELMLPISSHASHSFQTHLFLCFPFNQHFLIIIKKSKDFLIAKYQISLVFKYLCIISNVNCLSTSKIILCLKRLFSWASFHYSMIY